MPTLQELRDQRAAAYTEAQTYNERSNSGEMTGEEETAWERALGVVDELGVQIANRERQAELDKRFTEIDDSTTATEPGGERSDYAAAFGQYLRHGNTDMDAELRSVLAQGFQRAQGTSPSAAGGYTVPTTFLAKVTETMKAFGGATNGVESIGTDSGAPINWPSLDDTDNEGYYIGENTQLTNEGDLEFGLRALDAFTCASGPILISEALLQDSGIDIEGLIARKMGERLARRKNRAMTVGSGSNEPQGYLAGLTTGKTTTSATAITYNELVDLVHSVDAAYRASGRARFKLHDLVLAEVRKLRDDSGGAGIGAPIWQPSIQDGVPDRLLGYAYDVNNHAPSAITTGQKTVAFGDWQAAYIERVVNSRSTKRLVERYAENLQIGFIGFERHDGMVQDASAAKLLVQA